MKCTHSATCSCIIERMIKREAVPLRGFFPKLGFFAGFSPNTNNLAGRISKCYGRGGGRAAPGVFPVNEPEKGGCAAHGLVANYCTIKTYIVS